MTTSASTAGLPEDRAYLLHHFNCPLQALHRAGMLAGPDHQPTEAGRAYFSQPTGTK